MNHDAMQSNLVTNNYSRHCYYEYGHSFSSNNNHDVNSPANTNTDSSSNSSVDNNDDSHYYATITDTSLSPPTPLFDNDITDTSNINMDINMDMNDVVSINAGLPTEIDVLVIGTGPSALFTSFLLSGYRPILESRDLTRAYAVLPRWLSTPLASFIGVPLTDQQLLRQIALPLLDSPLGARSRNPLALLLDALERPGADAGEEHASLLTWKRVARPISHCVVGRTDPGGLWSHMAQDEQQALSVANQLALPGYTFRDWWLQYRSDKYTDKTQYDSEQIDMMRPTRSDIAHYYKAYIDHTNIASSIYSQSTITEVHWLEDTSTRLYSASTNELRYRICGLRELSATTTSTTTSTTTTSTSFYNRHEHKTIPFEIHAQSIVIACGMFDEPKRLGVPGESADWIQHHPFINTLLFREPFDTHSQMVLKKTPMNVLPTSSQSQYAMSMPSSFCYPSHYDHATTTTQKGEQKEQLFLPYLVVGSGLSAADALNRLRGRKQRALHVFLSDSAYRSRKRLHAAPPLASGFTSDTYPEYHATRRRMLRAQRASNTFTSNTTAHSETWYEGVPDAQVIRFRRQYTPQPVYRVDLRLSDGQIVTRSVAGAIIVIGRHTRPQFLRGRLSTHCLLMPSSTTPPTLNNNRNNNSSSNSNSKKYQLMNTTPSVVVEYGSPLLIDPWTSRVVDEQGKTKHLGFYAVGAITGDTTVRFGLGAPLGVLLSLMEDMY
ncbi:hypothetical protein BDF19DRAFT_410216 [Syncephalis fuscata]|nr:hypothetical protein BDF19DRAFT_410216 [Syncephalis fuscata]